MARLLNELAEDRARGILESCCGSARWVGEMLARRPYPGDGSILSLAGEIWWPLAREDWLEAFSHHPRIGGQPSPQRANAASRAWSRREQAEAANAGTSVQEALREGNLAYEGRFGYVFLIRAAGRGAEEILADLRRRLGNDPVDEIREAAGQQLEITCLRLEQWQREQQSTDTVEEA